MDPKEKVDEEVEETVDTTESEITEETKSTEENDTGLAGDEKTIAEEAEIKPEPDKTETEDTSESKAEEAETTDDETDDSEGIDVSAFIDEGDKKTNTQKRIDKLTADKYKLQAELDQLKVQETSPKKDKTYTPEELKRATDRAVADGDSGLLHEIMDQREKQLENRLRNEYTKREEKIQEQTARNKTEWTQVVNSYDYLADAKEAEVYHGSRTELNINDPNSLLRQVALALFTSSDDEKLFQLYHRPGGQALAVSDALNLILKKRRGRSPEDSEKKGLKRKLSKERRKKSLTAHDGSIKEEASTKPKKQMTDAERVFDAIEERKKPVEKLRASYK